MGEWTRLVAIAFELLFASIVIGLIAFLFSIAQDAGDREQARIDASQEMQEYRQYNRWDNDNAVFYQDIVELILLNQNSVEFRIVKLNETTSTIPTNTVYTWYTRDNIRGLLYEGQAKHYRARLLRDIQDPGKILGYTFTASMNPPGP